MPRFPILRISFVPMFSRCMLIAILFVSASVCRAQLYIDSTNVSIADYGPLSTSYLNISMDSTHIHSIYGLEEVCVNIYHSSDEQIGIYLMSPDGTMIELSSGNGGSGDNYLNCCFNMSASSLITSGTASFSGSFIPEHNLGNVNNGQNPNGSWRLLVQDLVYGDTGYIDSWSLRFGFSPPAPSSTSVGPCDDFNEAGCICKDSAVNCLLLPDMIIAESMLADTLFQSEAFDTFRVTNSCANIGFGPMAFIGTGQWYCGDSLVSGNVLCPDGSWSQQKVLQRVHIKSGLGYFDYMDTVVGYMSFHSSLGHHHLHVENWSQNSLRIKGPEADPLQWPVIALGNKVSFCLYDHLMCSPLFKNCSFNDSVYTYADLPNNGLGAGFDDCGSSVQGISVGYSDIYDYLLPGQEIPLDSICNGNYYLVAAFDPLQQFIDGDRSNNISIAAVRLKEQLSVCCIADFEIDTMDAFSYHFIDRSRAIPDSLQWDFGDGFYSNESFLMHTYAAAGLYEVQLAIWNSDGCRDTLKKTLYIDSAALSIAPAIDPISFEVRPNPSNGECVIQLQADLEGWLEIEVLDLFGQLISREQRYIHTQQENKIPLQLNEAGIFVVKLRTEGWNQSLKIVSLPKN